MENRYIEALQAIQQLLVWRVEYNVWDREKMHVTLENGSKAVVIPETTIQEDLQNMQKNIDNLRKQQK